MTDRPLTDDELAFFNHCNHIWCEPGLGGSSIKTGPLSDELKARLVRLGAVYSLTVEFPIEDVPKRGEDGEDEVVPQQFVRAEAGKRG